MQESQVVVGKIRFIAERVVCARGQVAPIAEMDVMIDADTPGPLRRPRQLETLIDIIDYAIAIQVKENVLVLRIDPAQ